MPQIRKVFFKAAKRVMEIEGFKGRPNISPEEGLFAIANFLAKGINNQKSTSPQKIPNTRTLHPVFCRKNIVGHGDDEFMMSCYDAALTYDRNSDTFCARYPTHSARSLVTEDGISWERIRKPPVVTSPRELYIPEVPEELRPGDHIEVQWKRIPSFPYGWWYGIIGHSDNCNNENQNCRCHLDEMVWLEFKQYTMGSGWRQFQMTRNRASEVGCELYGFYGGIRKLNNEGDICAWLQMWPKDPL
ncbi:hypothetical protein KI387_032407 [Taxus chinensis]|uniref:Uncharacterized protein n=1 Tax=Taxus chinensis TaxID=29808 RepID=A0AA38BP57_TAXCH|nr:hypothetical protein KI387_032407 [Taxus chinensis]